MRALDLMPGHTSHYSNLAEITMDVYNICERIRNGDESGWKGDPSASVMFNPLTAKFEVWLVDGQNVPYIAASGDRCDHSLIVKLIEGDWRKGHQLLKELQTKNRAAHQAQIDSQEDMRMELADKLHWAILKDIGHLEGGTHRQTSFYAKGK